MTGYDGSIRIKTDIDNSGIKKGLNGTKQTVDNAVGHISKSLRKITGLIATAFSVMAVVKFGKECIDVATETQNAWIGLNSILTGQGKSFEIAKSFINDYVSDGLIPLNNAVSAYKNLALRGYSSDQIQKTMIALKNSATFARQSTYSLGDAVQTATEGLKNENSVVVDNAGVTKNVAKMWEDYAKVIGKTTNNLTQAEKIQAEVNGILEETKFQSHDAAIYSSTYAGKLAQLNSAFTTMKTAIGNVVQPIAKLFIPIITTAINGVTKLFTTLSGLLALFGLKADSVETVSSGLGDLATEAGQASDAIKGIGNSATQAGKDAKKASKDLTSFDRISKLSDNKNSNASGTSGSGEVGALAQIKDSIDVTSTIKEDTSLFDGLISRVKELIGLFKEGFDISFGDTNFDGILSHFDEIKSTLIDIWTDPDVTSAVDNWIQTVMYSLGQTIGGIARIGVNIAEGLVGSIDNYLSQNVDRIKSFITKMFDISSESWKLSGNFFHALSKISDVFSSDTAKQIGANIISMFVNPLMSVTEFLAKFVLDLQAVFIQPIIDNTQKIKSSIENTLKPIETITNTVSKALTEGGDKLNEIYDKNMKPLLDSLKTGFSNTFGKILESYNQYVAPMIQRMADKIGELWNEHLKPLTDKVGGLLGSIFGTLTDLYNNVLKPIIDWIVENIVPIIVPILETISSMFLNVFGVIANVIRGIIDVLKGLIDFIVGVFSGDWEKAWQGIQSIVEGIWGIIQGNFDIFGDSIKDIFSGITEWFKNSLGSWGSLISDIWNNLWTGISSFFINIWNKIKEFAFNIFNSILNKIDEIFPGMKEIIITVINNIKEKIGSVFNNIKENITNIITNIKNTIQSIWNSISSFFSNTIDNIKSKFINGFNSVKDGIVNIFNGIKNKITEIVSSFVNIIKKPINAVIELINKAIGSLNKIYVNIPSWVPGIGGQSFGVNIPKIPKLAKGGIAYRPTYAQIGEAGKEAILPLENNTEWMDTFTDKLAEKIGFKKNDSGDIVIYVVVDGEIIQKVVNKRQKKNEFATNGGL